ncbi:MAG: DUF1698 domain-containing protein, partial [Gammaproteobacteria bacterium]
MHPEELRRRVQAFPRWHYAIDLGHGIETPIHDPTWANRHRQRKRYFFDPLVKAGLFQGKRVLDLGCNAGFWSLAAVEAGCSFVLGIDARRMHIEQAELVFKAKGIPKERYRFVHANIFDVALPASSFDIALCLGLLYHTCKPMELLERIRAANTDILIIDSTVANRPEAILKLRREPLDDPRMSADYELVALPSPAAIQEMTQVLGYTCLPLEPRFDRWEGCEDFQKGDRLAFA